MQRLSASSPRPLNFAIQNTINLRSKGGKEEVLIKPHLCTDTVNDLPICDIVVVSVKGYDLMRLCKAYTLQYFKKCSILIVSIEDLLSFWIKKLKILLRSFSMHLL